MIDPINFTFKEFCAVVPCGRTKGYELIAGGQVEAIKLGKKTLIPRMEVERLQARLPRIPRRSPDPTPRAIGAEPIAVAKLSWIVGRSA